MNDQESGGTARQRPMPRVPKSREEAVVRCKEFQCRAYKGREGQWHSAADDSVLEVVEIVLRFDLLAATPVS
ncbi:MAG TPA: hypothetical protein VFE51_11135 [Verrucomicrobiae bacterium]|nr:hypothetical protein [Verrucomicrobiae bacterium]